MQLLADHTVEHTFGTISPPPAISKFIGSDPTGTGGISQFLSNLIVLIYSIASIVLIFMLLWGAFEWLTSGGDKEKVAGARARLIYAFIGIILFAVAFAIIQVLGTFTGFRFFKGQNMRIYRDTSGNINRITCPNGLNKFGTNLDPDTACLNDE